MVEKPKANACLFRISPEVVETGRKNIQKLLDKLGHKLDDYDYYDIELNIDGQIYRMSYEDFQKRIIS